MREKKSAAGSTLIEVLVAIALFGLVVVPLSAALMTAHRLNARSETLLREQLAAANAMETLLARGVDPDADYGGAFESVDDVVLTPVDGLRGGYSVTVRSGETTLTSFIRAAGEGDP